MDPSYETAGLQYPAGFVPSSGLLKVPSNALNHAPAPSDRDGTLVSSGPFLTSRGPGFVGIPTPADQGGIIDNILRSIAGLKIKILMDASQALLQALGSVAQDDDEEALDKLKDAIENFKDATDADKAMLLGVFCANHFGTIDPKSLPFWREQEYEKLLKIFNDLNKEWADDHNGVSFC